MGIQGVEATGPKAPQILLHTLPCLAWLIHYLVQRAGTWVCPLVAHPIA